MKTSKNMILLLFILLLLSIFLSKCGNKKEYKIIDFDGKVIYHSFIEKVDNYLCPRYIDTVECYITPEFLIFERLASNKRIDKLFHHNWYYILDLIFANSKDTISLLKYQSSYNRLFETKDFYYFPYEVCGGRGFNEKKDAIYKLGLLVIYKESMKYDTISFINENFVSIRQENKNLIVRTNKLYLEINIFGFIVQNMSGHTSKYLLVESDEYKEYIFVK